MGIWSLHTHTDDRGCHCYLVPVDSDGRYDDHVAVGDPLVFDGPVVIHSDAHGRKILEAPAPPRRTEGGEP